VLSVFLQGLAQGLILHPPPLGKARRVGGQKGERQLGIALILGKVKADAPDLVPDGGVLFQPPTQTVLRDGDLFAHPRVQINPKTTKDVGAQVFPALHGRRGKQHGRQFAFRWQFNRIEPIYVRLGHAAELCQVEAGEIPPKGK
jgi:hypothetical protein